MEVTLDYVLSTFLRKVAVGCESAEVMIPDGLTVDGIVRCCRPWVVRLN
jgi:hypothetical protein